MRETEIDNVESKSHACGKYYNGITFRTNAEKSYFLNASAEWKIIIALVFLTGVEK